MRGRWAGLSAVADTTFKAAFVRRAAFELTLQLEAGEGIGPSVSGRKDPKVMEVAGARTSEPGS